MMTLRIDRGEVTGRCSCQKRRIRGRCGKFKPPPQRGENNITVRRRAASCLLLLMQLRRLRSCGSFIYDVAPQNYTQQRRADLTTNNSCSSATSILASWMIFRSQRDVGGQACGNCIEGIAPAPTSSQRCPPLKDRVYSTVEFHWPISTSKLGQISERRDTSEGSGCLY